MPSARPISLLLLLLAPSVSAFVPVSNLFARPALVSSRVVCTPLLKMAIDYNDPAVMEEFNNVQTMEYDEVVAELMQSGVRAPADMGDMDVKLMLVELRTVMKGGGSSSAEQTPPTSYSSAFEEALWTKPVFKELYDSLKVKGDHNEMNVAAEYVNDPEGAKARYTSSYGSLIDRVEKALNAKPEVTSPKIKFSGFPANMGGEGVKMTLGALGGVVDFVCNESDDFPVLVGEVTFDSVDSAKAAIEQYDGMDMGMGEKLQVVSI